MVRYDAYGEMSGRQSSSIALLDDNGTGVVMSSILHREQARLYVKGVREASREFELSPEENEAVAAAQPAGSRRESPAADAVEAGRLPRARRHVHRGGPARLAEARQLEPVPEPTVYECVMAVHAREVDQAIVPIENSLEGPSTRRSMRSCSRPRR